MNCTSKLHLNYIFSVHKKKKINRLVKLVYIHKSEFSTIYFINNMHFIGYKILHYINM